jgi:hypothetical protein
MAVTGRSEFALRFPSLCCGVLAVVLLYRLAILWCGHQSAIWSAFLLTWQPLSIWYAQDGRMYAALMMLPLLSLYFAARLWSGKRSKWFWIGYGVAGVVGLMTHYMSALAMLAQEACALCIGWRARDGKFVLRWHIVQIAVVVLCLPWLIYALPLLRSHTSSWVQPTSLPQILWRVLRAYTVGLTLDWRLALVPVLASAGALLLGGGSLWRAGRRLELCYLLALIVVPVLSIALLSAYRPAFDERYLLFVMMPILILMGRGLAQKIAQARYRKWSSLRERWQLAAQSALAVLVVGGMWVSLGSYRFNPAYAKSRRWGELFDYLESRVEPGDVIVYTYPDPAPEVYVDGRWPIEIMPTSSSPTWNRLLYRAKQIAAQYDRIWLIPQWSPQWDRSGMTEEALDAICERAAELRVGSWSLVLYHTPQLYLQEIEDVDAQFGGDIDLVGYVLRSSEGKAVNRVEAAPGDQVRLSLYWRAMSAMDSDYVVFVHLIDETGFVRGQQDNQPRQGTLPTSVWIAGDLVVDIYRVLVAENAPEGALAIELGLYRPTDIVRLPVKGADADVDDRRVLISGRVQVERSDLDGTSDR